MPDFDPYLTWLGVPLSQRPPTCYQLLGVDPSITDPEVVKTLAIQRIAYVRNFQRGEHGDVCARILEELVQAEAVLTNPARRAEYDRSLRPVEPVRAAVPVKAVTAPTVAVPARPTRIPETPARKGRSKSRKKEGQEVVKWAVGTVTAVVVLMGLFSLPKLFSGPPTSTLRIVFDDPWGDAAVSIDGQRVPMQANGGTLTLAPGEHRIEVERGKHGRFEERVDLTAKTTTEVKVPRSAFVSEAEIAARPLVAKYRVHPEDAEVHLSGKAMMDRQPPVVSLTFLAASMNEGIDLTFSKLGFVARKIRVKASDAAVSTPIDVALEPVKRSIARIAVDPPDARVSYFFGSAQRTTEPGVWEVAVVGEQKSANVSVFADGYAQKTLDVPLDGSTTNVTLLASHRGIWSYYQSLPETAALRLVGRAGAFASGARAIGLSKNGKFLAVAEGSYPVRVHVWDVAKRQFMGPIMKNDEIQGRPDGPPVSMRYPTMAGSSHFAASSFPCST
jgi:hypothetical protein